MQIAEHHFLQSIWGLKVQHGDSNTIFEHNAANFLKPASNAKLYVTALALDQLSPDYRIRTSVYANTKADSSGIVAGDVIVYGRGDPTFSQRFNYGAYARSLKSLVDAIAASGVKRINGDIVADESFFRGSGIGSGWKWEDLQYHYGAAASALSIDDNVIRYTIKPGSRVGDPCTFVGQPETALVRIINRTRTTSSDGSGIRFYRAPGDTNIYFSGSLSVQNTKGATEAVAMPDPAALFAEQLKKRLVEKGITVSGRTRSVNWLERQDRPVDYSQMVEICSVNSRPLSEIINKTLKNSQGLYAQLLLLQVGSKYTENPHLNTEKAGLKMLESFLIQANINPEEVLLEDGAGLSRDGLVTANANVALLKYMAEHKYSNTFINSLPLAAVDGTLMSRFANTSAAKNLRAKTGTLPKVAALSGYLTNASGERLIFSMMLNNCNQSEMENKAALDSIVVMLANSTNLVQIPTNIIASP